MEVITNNHYYTQTRQFIETHATESFLSQEIKDKFVEFYQSVNTENAKVVYDEVCNLYNHAKDMNRREFNSAMLKLSLMVFLVSGATSLVGTAGTYLIPKISWFHRLSKWIQKIGYGGMVVGGCMLFAVGH
jgi:hypothetical protein